MRNFKAQAERDLLAVFHNTADHAEELEFWIDGTRYKGPVIIDDGGAQDRTRQDDDHVDGLTLIDIVMYVPLSILNQIPTRGLNVEIDGDLFEIKKVHPEAGDIVLYLERLTE